MNILAQAFVRQKTFLQPQYYSDIHFEDMPHSHMIQ